MCTTQLRSRPADCRNAARSGAVLSVGLGARFVAAGARADIAQRIQPVNDLLVHLGRGSQLAVGPLRPGPTLLRQGPEQDHSLLEGRASLMHERLFARIPLEIGEGDPVGAIAQYRLVVIRGLSVNSCVEPPFPFTEPQRSILARQAIQIKCVSRVSPRRPVGSPIHSLNPARSASGTRMSVGLCAPPYTTQGESPDLSFDRGGLA